MAFLEAHERLLKCPPLIAKFRHLLSPACATALMYLFGERDAVLLEVFVQILGEGEGKQTYPTLWLLREKLIKHAAGRAKFRPIIPAAWTVQAWNATRRGKKLKTLRYREGTPFPVIE